MVVQDAAHILLTYDGRPLSFLSIPGAKDVGVEVHSLSKGFDMIGWRIGWVCGNARSCRPSATSRTTATPVSSSPSRRRP